MASAGGDLVGDDWDDSGVIVKMLKRALLMQGFAQDDGGGIDFCGSHPIAKCAIGWGTLFRDTAEKKSRSFRFTSLRQDDSIRGGLALGSWESSVQ